MVWADVRQANDRLAILVPYRDRARYLEVFARALPEYLERVNGIHDYAIYVAEQESPDLFNLSLSRNVAACAALADGGFDTFVFHDVDIIPVAGIDYRPRPFNVAWFLSAGSCKVGVSDFVRSNGYNPSFVGWGDEDVEFYHRLETVGATARDWRRSPESRAAVAMNLDWPELPDEASLRESQRYYGHRDAGPRFVTWSRAAHGHPLEPYDKSVGFLREDAARCAITPCGATCATSRARQSSPTCRATGSTACASPVRAASSAGRSAGCAIARRMCSRRRRCRRPRPPPKSCRCRSSPSA